MDSGLRERSVAATERAAIRAALICAVLGGLVGGAAIVTAAVFAVWVVPRAEGLAIRLAPSLGVLGLGASLMLVGASGSTAALRGDGGRATRGLHLLVAGSAIAGLLAPVWIGHLVWFAWTRSAPTPLAWEPEQPWGLYVTTGLVLALPWGVGLLAFWARLHHRHALAQLESSDTPRRARRRRFIRLVAAGAMAIAATQWVATSERVLPPLAWGPHAVVRALDDGRLQRTAVELIPRLGPAVAPALLARLEHGPGLFPQAANWGAVWLEAIDPVVPMLPSGYLDTYPPVSEEEVLWHLKSLGRDAVGVADALQAWEARTRRESRLTAEVFAAIGPEAIPALERYVAARAADDELARVTLAFLLDDRDSERRLGSMTRILIDPGIAAAIRMRVAAVLAFRGPTAIEALLVLRASPEPEVAAAAEAAIRAIVEPDAGHASAVVRAMTEAARAGEPLAQAPAVRALIGLAPTEPDAPAALVALWSELPDCWPGAPRGPAATPDLLPGLRAVRLVADPEMESRLGSLIAEIEQRSAGIEAAAGTPPRDAASVPGR